MDSLPDHILTRIFYFTFESPQFLVSNCSSVCKSFRSAIFRPQLWRNLNLIVPENPEQLESLRSFLQSTVDGNIADWIKRLSLAVGKRSAERFLKPEVFELFIPSMAHLQELKIEWGDEFLQRSTLVHLIKCCPSVAIIELGIYSEFGVLTAMANGWPKLNCAIIRMNFGFHEYDFDEFSRICHCLTVCHVNPLDMRPIPTASMEKMLDRHGRTLKSLSKVEWILIPKVATVAPQMEELDIKTFYNSDVGSLAAFGNLKYLQFTCTWAVDTDSLIRVFKSANLHNLKALSFERYTVTWALVDCIAEHCPNLEALDFGPHMCAKGAEIVISRCQNLIAFKITCDYRTLNDNILDLIPSVNLPKLQLLHFYSHKHMDAIGALVERTAGLKVKVAHRKILSSENGAVVQLEQIDRQWIDQLKRKLDWPPMTVGHFLSQGECSSFLC